MVHFGKMYLKLTKCSRGVLGIFKSGLKSATFYLKVPGAKGWRTENVRMSVFALTALRWLAENFSARSWSIFGKKDPSNASVCRV